MLEFGRSANLRQNILYKIGSRFHECRIKFRPRMAPNSKQLYLPDLWRRPFCFIRFNDRYSSSVEFKPWNIFAELLDQNGQSFWLKVTIHGSFDKEAFWYWCLSFLNTWANMYFEQKTELLKLKRELNGKTCSLPLMVAMYTRWNNG